MALPAVPVGRREAVDVADRGRAAELLEPAAPPTGGGKMRVEQVGLEAAGGQGQPRDRQEICFSADAEAIERQVRGEQFEVGPAAACHKMADELVERSAAHQPGQERFGAGQFRGRDCVQHPRRTVANEAGARGRTLERAMVAAAAAH